MRSHRQGAELVEILHAGGVQLVELKAAELGDYALVYAVAVVVVGPDLYGALALKVADF